VPMQLAQCWFPGLATFNAKLKNIFSNKIYIRKQFLSNSNRKQLWLEITKILIAVQIINSLRYLLQFSAHFRTPILHTSRRISDVEPTSHCITRRRRQVLWRESDIVMLQLVASMRRQQSRRLSSARLGQDTRFPDICPRGHLLPLGYRILFAAYSS